eukprot:TRINITY_DN66763_c0_g1_i1.p1 TRINITY_DN66763_c0_g1~~TRINITY_DN66763_c0_g1_i1.p1  ORF type:complete len:228 (+),score=49.99 TRINITY_DN66763_c0_g1_i1:85-768(+)
MAHEFPKKACWAFSTIFLCNAFGKKLDGRSLTYGDVQALQELACKQNPKFIGADGGAAPWKDVDPKYDHLLDKGNFKALSPPAVDFILEKAGLICEPFPDAFASLEALVAYMKEEAKTDEEGEIIFYLQYLVNGSGGVHIVIGEADKDQVTFHDPMYWCMEQAQKKAEYKNGSCHAIKSNLLNGMNPFELDVKRHEQHSLPLVLTKVFRREQHSVISASSNMRSVNA